MTHQSCQNMSRVETRFVAKDNTTVENSRFGVTGPPDQNMVETTRLPAAVPWKGNGILINFKASKKHTQCS